MSLFAALLLGAALPASAQVRAVRDVTYDATGKLQRLFDGQ